MAGWLRSSEGGLRWAKNFLLFIFTLIAFKVLATILGTAIRKAVSRISGASELLKDFIVNSVRKVTLVVGVVIALSMLEVNIGPFLAAIGAAGFILGFALQGTLSNFAAGLMILMYRPWQPERQEPRPRIGEPETRILSGDLLLEDVLRAALTDDKGKVGIHTVLIKPAGAEFARIQGFDAVL